MHLYLHVMAVSADAAAAQNTVEKEWERWASRRRSLIPGTTGMRRASTPTPARRRSSIVTVAGLERAKLDAMLGEEPAGRLEEDDERAARLQEGMMKFYRSG